MKLTSFLLPALAGAAAAKDSEAEAYIFQSSSPSESAPSISAPVAQAILQQRLGYAKQLPNDLDDADVQNIRLFSKPVRRIFTDATAEQPHQLVIVVKNADADRVKTFKTAVSGQNDVSFTAPGLDYLPSSYLPGWTKSQCAIADAVDLNNEKCWRSKVQYLEYDAAKDQKSVAALSKNMDKLRGMASSKMETTIFLLPSASTPDDSKLHRRGDFGETERVMLEETQPEKAPSSLAGVSKAAADVSSKPHPFAEEKKKPIPACFTTQNACETATGNCTGHGACTNKYSSEGAQACFACQCRKTHENGGKSTWFWGGSSCEKQDVSVPFWIFLGFTVFLIGAVGFSIGMLFEIGEEKLPGVIGAGVSRGSK